MKAFKILYGSAVAATLVLSSCTCRERIESKITPPAYPLVSIDPFTSAWSMTDKLYDEPVKHWTGKEFPLVGALKVDGQVYRFMGVEDIEMDPVAPTSIQGDWTGRWTTKKPAGDWTAMNYNDSKWAEDKGAFGTTWNEPTAKTVWSTREIWVRRVIELEESLENKAVWLEFCNDDDAVFYVNGIKVHSTGPVCNKEARIKLPAEVTSTLKAGKNIIAAECINPVANGLLDFGLIAQKETNTALENTAEQTAAQVQATQTYYTFNCGPVELELTFTAPLLMDNLDLLSRPVNYITYNINSKDGKSHEMELYMEAAQHWALNTPYQPSESDAFVDGDLVFVRTGSKRQPVLRTKGDDHRIDWGYFYLAADACNTKAAVGNGVKMRNDFVAGAFNEDMAKKDASKMALVTDLGNTDKVEGRYLIGYDDLYSIQYFKENLRPYWNRKGDKTIVGEFHNAAADYKSLMAKCSKFDRKLMIDACKAGGQKYAELCAMVYRQAIHAHKLVETTNGDIAWLSKENNSNGSIGTVDVTYPSAPLFLIYNPVLAEGMMNPIYYYSESGLWTKPFPAHDVGTYPLANGQTYGGDMPVEESGNMIVLTAAVCHVKGDASYAKKHWDILTTWTDYLVENGLDPNNQLCTDDFAGHFAHNINLSAKAIMGVASYGRMAKMLGMNDVAEKYTAIAKDMASKWIEMADDGDHYRLTFDKPGTWSQKYNLVWDKLLKLDIFPEHVMDTEIAYYLGKQNEYGLPLDSRKLYTKTDWVIWTATIADSDEDFNAFIEPLYRFYDETEDRVPASDWTWTDSAHHRGFKARSVVGGFFMKMLEDKL